jgi:glucose/arabinose dehydrogenase
MKSTTFGKLPLIALGAGLLIAAVLLTLIKPAQSAGSLPPGFTVTKVAGGLTGGTDLEFAPDGRLFVNNQGGLVRIVKPGGNLTTFYNLSAKVGTDQERGLMEIAFDPKFSKNHYVYLYYTMKATSNTPAHNRVVRVTAKGDKAVKGSEKLIFRLPNQRTPRHHGGSLDFSKGGKLYVSVGDNEQGTPAQSLKSTLGKILRINKDGTIPKDNPFYKRTKGQPRAIWALGFRNPFKIAVQPDTGTLFINDVGGLGSKAWEEINRRAPRAKDVNYGWPEVQGPANDPKFKDPISGSYRHTNTPGCCVITGGAFYNPAKAQFPRQYVGDYFFTDNSGEWIKTRDSATGKVTTFATGIPAGIGTGSRDLEVSKNGSLYQLGNGFLAKISYTG